MEVIGLDHIYITVSDFERSEAFYDQIMQSFGFRKGDKPISGEPHAHYFNRHLQYSIRPTRDTFQAHNPYSPGVHHICFQVTERKSVDDAFKILLNLGIEASSPQEYPEYSDDYYATFFTDPDGIRLEIVARSRHRKEIVARWDEMRVFLNPIADLKAKAQ